MRLPLLLFPGQVEIDLTGLEQRMKKSFEWLQTEYGTLQAAANPLPRAPRLKQSARACGSSELSLELCLCAVTQVS